MSLFFTARVTTTRYAATTLGTVEIRRRDDLDLADPAVLDAVCTYTVALDGDDLGTVQHRYGDGAFRLIGAAMELVPPPDPGTLQHLPGQLPRPVTR